MSNVAGTPPELDGSIEPPRKNGELVFEAPWEARAFGIAMVLHQQDLYLWREFSDRLAVQIAGDDTSPDTPVLPPPPDTESRYYRQWFAALEGLVRERGLLTAEEIDARTKEFAAGLWDDHHDDYYGDT
jgi:nitrile hydratase accessory protein